MQVQLPDTDSEAEEPKKHPHAQNNQHTGSPTSSSSIPSPETEEVEPRRVIRPYIPAGTLENVSLPAKKEPGGGFAGRNGVTVPMDKPPILANRKVTEGTFKKEPTTNPETRKKHDSGITIYRGESCAISEITTPSDLVSLPPYDHVIRDYDAGNVGNDYLVDLPSHMIPREQPLSPMSVRTNPRNTAHLPLVHQATEGFYFMPLQGENVSPYDHCLNQQTKMFHLQQREDMEDFGQLSSWQGERTLDALTHDDGEAPLPVADPPGSKENASNDESSCIVSLLNLPLAQGDTRTIHQHQDQEQLYVDPQYQQQQQQQQQQQIVHAFQDDEMAMEAIIALNKYSQQQQQRHHVHNSIPRLHASDQNVGRTYRPEHGSYHPAYLEIVLHPQEVSMLTMPTQVEMKARRPTTPPPQQQLQMHQGPAQQHPRTRKDPKARGQEEPSLQQPARFHSRADANQLSQPDTKQLQYQHQQQSLDRQEARNPTEQAPANPCSPRKSERRPKQTKDMPIWVRDPETGKIKNSPQSKKANVHKKNPELEHLDLDTTKRLARYNQHELNTVPTGPHHNANRSSSRVVPRATSDTPETCIHGPLLCNTGPVLFEEGSSHTLKERTEGEAEKPSGVNAEDSKPTANKTASKPGHLPRDENRDSQHRGRPSSPLEPGRFTTAPHSPLERQKGRVLDGHSDQCDPLANDEIHFGEEERGERSDSRGVKLVTKEEKHRQLEEIRAQNARYRKIWAFLFVALTLIVIVVAIVVITTK
jgi:hypothetical protein